MSAYPTGRYICNQTKNFIVNHNDAKFIILIFDIFTYRLMQIGTHHFLVVQNKNSIRLSSYNLSPW